VDRRHRHPDRRSELHLRLQSGCRQAHRKSQVAVRRNAFVENLDFQGQPLRIEYKGKISGDEIKFQRKVADVATEDFVAKRAK
jgi:hypothetical protein